MTTTSTWDASRKTRTSRPAWTARHAVSKDKTRKNEVCYRWTEGTRGREVKEIEVKETENPIESLLSRNEARVPKPRWATGRLNTNTFPVVT